MKNNPNSLPRVRQSPDDLMGIPIRKLAWKLHGRLARQRRFERLLRDDPGEQKGIIRQLLARERKLVRVARVAMRIRLDEFLGHLYGPIA